VNRCTRRDQAASLMQTLPREDVVGTDELPRQAPAAAKLTELLQGIPPEDPDLVVRSVSEVEELLSLVRREG